MTTGTKTIWSIELTPSFIQLTFEIEFNIFNLTIFG
jgi:hypothetical protein